MSFPINIIIDMHPWNKFVFSLSVCSSTIFHGPFFICYPYNNINRCVFIFIKRISKREVVKSFKLFWMFFLEIIN